MDDIEKHYSIEIDDHGEYLHAVVGGLKATPEIVMGYWHDIIDECDAKKCSKILLEHNFIEMISMSEMAAIIGPVGDMLLGHYLAFYDRFGQYDVPEAGKMILRSHDVRMQIFHDLEAAEKWLLAN